MRQIGRDVRPLGWRNFTSGRAIYSSDLRMDGLLVGRVLRSPLPHARVKIVDVTEARAMPGVHAVITAADFPLCVAYPHEGAADRTPIARHTVRFAGEEVAAAAAETVEQADKALRRIRVDYEPLPAPFAIAEAQADRAPELHRRDTGRRNVARRLVREWGDVARARADGPIVVEGRYWHPHLTHACMETNNTLALWDDDGRLHLWTGTQAPALLIEELAVVLGISGDRILCHEAFVGGGFGSKSRISEHEAIAATLARVARRPVRVSLSRWEEFATTKTRHAWRIGLKVHADETGRLRALDGLIEADNGAYVHSGYSVLSCGPKAYGTLYGLDALAVEALLIDTSKQPGGQFRGYGTTQAVYALESLMDELAQKLGIDPIELRIRNANRPFTQTVQGARMQSARLAECLEAVRRAIDWDKKKAERRPGQGLGVASGIHSSGSYAFAGANRSDSAVDVFADGRVRLRFGGADTGTGQRTILAQIAAEALGLMAKDVEVLSTETRMTPYDLGAWSSRGTYYSGNAAKKAAALAAGRLKTLAARRLGNGEITLSGGMAHSEGQSVSLATLVGEAPEAVDGALVTDASYVETEAEMLDKDGRGNLSPTYSFAAHAVEVEVDWRTGKVRVVDYVAAHDVGTAINPGFVRGQIAGGAVMGLGAALGEELIHEQGRLVNPAFVNYAMPRAGDLPAIRTILVEGGDPKGPYGAKSVGELSITPPAPAIANAIFDAIGARIADLPITPDKVLTALAKKEGRRRSYRIWARPGCWWTALVRALYPRGLFKLLHAHGPSLRHRPTPPEIAEIAAPLTVGEAVAMLGSDAKLIAGGTDLLPLRAQNLVAPSRLVSVTDIPALRRLEISSEGALAIGAAVTLRDLVRGAGERIPLLAEAVRHLASPQIRAMATVGGNLLQDKRCWFFRNGFDCYKRGGVGRPCYAVLGDHRFYHAVIGGGRCQATTPSDLATALVALDAEILVEGPHGRRSLPAARLYKGPGESALTPAEILVEVRISGANAARRGAFEKLGLWEGDFAVASVAVTVDEDERGAWSAPRIVFGGIAPIPWRACRTEKALEGNTPDLPSIRRVLDEELDGAAFPLARNAWKIDAAAGLLQHAVERLERMRLPTSLQANSETR